MGRTHNQARGNIIRDADGNGTYALGGQVNCKFGTVTYEDTTAKRVFSLPQGAEIVDWQVNVTTAFNSSGTDLLDIGTSGSAAAYANDLDVSATGQINSGFVPGVMYTPLAAETDVYATFVQSVADAAAGSAVVRCFFILR
jgi:hypothetical protein